MDDDVFMTTSAQSEAIYTDTVGIFVDAQWGSSTQAGVQLCPAVFVPSASAIPRAVKHIYSRLATAASELDQGVPEVQLSLVGTGNSFSFENTDRLVRGMGQLITRCTLWAVTSGEQNDPLANAMAIALRSTLTQSDSPEETLLIVVNSVDVRHAVPTSTLLAPSGVVSRPSPSMTDARLNTFYMVWSRQQPSEQQMLLFRTATAIKLANPPPALLIGVPEERVPSSTAGLSAAAQTPMSAPPISPILLPSAPSAERQPLPIVLFCGASLLSLVELVAYVQCGVPVLVVQDISELCVVLKGAFSLFQSAGFEHCAFEAWLDRELRMVALATTGKYSEGEIEEAKQRVVQLLLMASTTEYSLLAFMAAHQMDQLGNQLLDLLVRSVADAAEMSRALQLAVKVGAAKTVNGLRLEGMLGDEQVSVLLRSALSSDDRIDVLASLLNQNIPLLVNSELLLGWHADTGDQYFFNAIILGHYFGIDCELNRIDEQFATRINRLMCHLCGGVSVTLFSPELFGTSPQFPVHDQERSIRALIVWALLINRPELVRLFCAYSAEPMALALALAKASRTLARKSLPWLFYDQPLQRLAQQLSQFAVNLLDIAYRDNPAKAYNSLCRPMSTFRQLTLTQFAFETNARNFLAHECCQRWVLRLLYGRIHLRNICRICPFPNWLKILLSALFLLPATFWVRIRRENCVPDARRPTSPTVALLEDGRQMKKLRSSSQNSMHSMRSAIYAFPPSRDDLRNPTLLMPPMTTMNEPNIVSNGPIVGGEQDTISPTQGMSTNDESTVTDSFLPSASQVRENGAESRKDTVQHQQQQQLIRVSLHNGAGGSAEMGHLSVSSRRQSPDRRSLMFCDGTSTGGGGTSSRRRSRSSRLFGIGTPRGGAGKNTSFSSKFHRSPSSSSSKDMLGCCPTLSLFYATPITKYWLSLAFRLLYLAMLGWSVALPGCGLSPGWQLLLWAWSLCWLFDSLWVFLCQAQNSRWTEQRWALFDLCTTGTFLVALVALRVTHWSSSAYVIRACWALFLLYECYKTMFIYVPISHIFGPMLVRIRLMITRDLVNFLLLILLVLVGNAIAIKAVLYPDLSASPQTIVNSVDWTFQQLFTTDLTVLEQSAECKRQLLPQNRPFCQGVGGYANPRCPAQGWFAQLTVFEFFVFLKLLSWPILFALFARTAKRVEEEADQIWKYQLYSLATAFSVRPCLPPPFTPLFLVSVACCRWGGDGGNGFACLLRRKGIAHCLATDHPDIGTQAPHSPQSKYIVVYKNPSVPVSRGRPLCGYWRRLAVAQWKNATERPAEGKQQQQQHALHQPFADKAHLLIAFSCLQQQMDNDGTAKGAKMRQIAAQSDGEKPARIEVPSSERNWLRLQPHYRPNSFYKSADQFPAEVQKHVDDPSAKNLIEIGRQWRQRCLQEMFSAIDDWKQSQTLKNARQILLNGAGLPLNPGGRTGMAGRGEFARFGPNRMLLYALIRRFVDEDDDDEEQQDEDEVEEIQVLVLSGSGLLPFRWRYSPGRPMVDEHLAQLLLQLGLPDPDIHTLSTKTAIAQGDRDGYVAHVCTERTEAPGKEMDNAWAEAQLWALDLSAFSSLHQQLPDGGEYSWRSHRRLAPEQRRFVDRALKMFR